MCSDQWRLFVDTIADRPGVVGRIGRGWLAGGGSVDLPSADNSSEVTPAVGYTRLPFRQWTIVWCRTWCGCQHFRSLRDRTLIVSVRCLGGGWLGKVRSSRSVRRSLSVPWGPGAPSGTLHIARRTMQRLWGIMVFSCTTRDSSNGSGSHSPPGSLNSVVANGSTNSRGMRLLRQPFICSVMWSNAN